MKGEEAEMLSRVLDFAVSRARHKSRNWSSAWLYHVSKTTQPACQEPDFELSFMMFLFVNSLQ